MMTINWSAIDNHSVLSRTLWRLLCALPKGLVMIIRSGPAKGMKWIVDSAQV
jgi:hypothetical protein